MIFNPCSKFIKNPPKKHSKIHLKIIENHDLLKNSSKNTIPPQFHGAAAIANSWKRKIIVFLSFLKFSSFSSFVLFISLQRGCFLCYFICISFLKIEPIRKKVLFKCRTHKMYIFPLLPNLSSNRSFHLV